MITAGDFLKWLYVFDVQFGGGGPITIPVPVSEGGTGLTALPTPPTASVYACWDANKNMSANNFLKGFTTTATAASTTTLTVASTNLQFFTGSTTQTLVMPAVASLAIGTQYMIYNNSTGIVTVESSGTNVIQAMAANTKLSLTSVATSGTSAAVWQADYSGGGGSTPGYTTTATAAGTTTLTVSSTYLQYMTGSTTQTVVLPVTSTLALGQQYRIVNNSTGVVTVQSSGLNTIIAMGTLTEMIVTCISQSGTGTSSWSWEYMAWQNANGTKIGSDITVNGITIGLGTGAATTNLVIGTGAAAGVGTTFTDCVAIGYQTLAAATNAHTGNTCIGYQILSSATSPGNYNAFIGYQAGGTSASFTGTNNVGIGYQVMLLATSATGNIAFGTQSMRDITSGSYNTCVGYQAGYSIASNSGNCLYGTNAGLNLTGGTNTMLGYQSGYNMASGSTAVTSGTGNTLLGYQASANSATCSNAIAIGINSLAQASTGSTTGTLGPGISFGSSGSPVGFRGDGSIIPGNTNGGYWQPYINGTLYQIPLFASGTTGAVLLTSQTNTSASGISQYSDKGTGTESSNAVTVNHQAGVITTSSLSTTAGSSYAITLNNTQIVGSSNVILVTLSYGTNTTLYVLATAICTGAGTATITLYNTNAVSALNGTMLINFVIH